ncbi:MAG: CheR family methyltransferase [Candidatus Melainabacteria bacterium]|nr:CheR family methyltransferase [Candidatus Melainabacteria bacterium]
MNEPQTDSRFEGLLDYLKRTRGFDFTGYKRTSLTRRVQRRMDFVGVDDFIDYVDYLEVHPDEFTSLFNTILINVTGFFRDQPAWDYLEQDIWPIILAAKTNADPIRIWSAGCASGEEAYTLAMVICDIIGLEAFQQRVKIYATDVDEEALAQARAASYSEKSMRSITEKRIAKYFVKNGGDYYLFRPEMRRAVIFGRHDLVQDAPISKLDLLTCRNSLMYLNAETQTKILSRFHFALAETGHLFLGKAEMLLTHANLFTPTDVRYRIFSKTQRANLRDRLMVMNHDGDNDAVQHLSSQLVLKDCAYEVSLSPQVVIDTTGTLVLANERGRQMFGLTQKDIGRPLQDLELSYRPVELRSVIEQCYSGKHSVQLSGIERRTADGIATYLDVFLAPLSNNDGVIIGIAVTFVDVTTSFKLQSDLQRINQDLETANEELQSAHEELETTNEELQSTNEELETTNEELQSTNEELETMNEELQSTNEELETINGEQRQLTTDLHHTNAFLQSILSSVRSAVMVLDNNLKVMVWNPRAEDMWGLRSEEVKDVSLLELDFGLPIEHIREPLISFLNERSNMKELTVAATNRRGKAISCHIMITPLIGVPKESAGIVIMMDEK